MAASIIDGRALAMKMRNALVNRVQHIKDSKGIVPGLAVVLVGDDPASRTYVGMKEKASQKVGIRSEVYRLNAQTPEEKLLSLIDELNERKEIHGILVQLPLPQHIDQRKVIEKIDPNKDVDGFHPINMGRLVIGDEAGFIPCTPYGILKLLENEGIVIEGKKAVVVGRSNIVGKPMALLLLHRNATVTICHSRTQALAEVTREADILICAVGKPRVIKGDMVKPGAVVIDVGINRLKNELVGDVDFDEVREVAGWITPVPGGVGPMTITMLLHNTIEAALK